MYKELLQEDLDKCKILHDKIKSHEFRKNPQLYLLDEYAELFEDVDDVLKGWDWVNVNCQQVYRYYRYVQDRTLHYLMPDSPDGYYHYNGGAEIYAHPNIALIDYAMHDFRGLTWKLKVDWNNPYLFKPLFGKFIETTEKMLMILHNLINGEMITSMSFPCEGAFSKEQSTYEMVQNPHYDNDWTLKKYLHKEWYEDKGYVD